MKEPATLYRRYERRFTGATIPIPLMESVRRFLRTGKWVTEKFVMEEILPSDPRYVDAPYAETFIPHKDQINL